MRICLIGILLLFICTTYVSDANTIRLSIKNTAEDVTTGSYGLNGYVYVKDTDPLEALVAKTMFKAHNVKIDPANVHIQQREDQGEATAAIYTFMYDNTPYEGKIISYRKNGKWYDLSSFNSKLYRELRVQTIDSSGRVSIPSQSIETHSFEYRTVFGHIYDPNIRQVHIEYEDGTFTDIELKAGQTYYMDHQMTDIDEKQDFTPLWRITMYSSNGQLLYKRDYLAANAAV